MLMYGNNNTVDNNDDDVFAISAKYSNKKNNDKSEI